MVLTQIETILYQFRKEAKLIEIQEFKTGHINDTYLLICENEPKYVLQRINHSIFKNVRSLLENKVKITQFLAQKFDETNSVYQTLTFITTEDSHLFFNDSDGNFWNLMLYIENSKNFSETPNKELAFEAGKLIGNFLDITSEFAIKNLTETIPNFHNMRFRFFEFDEAIKKASEERLAISKHEIEKIMRIRNEMLTLQYLTEHGEIPIRVTHNDTKISNVLFTTENKGLCLIDLDTVMPGIIHYDFGDAIRTICASVSEDEKDLSKVSFKMEYYKSFTRGFLTSFQKISKIEANHLALSAKIMTFIMGLRMLTDYLNNDIYYKIDYDMHNLNRARNQFKLLDEMDVHYKEMQQIVSFYLG